MQNEMAEHGRFRDAELNSMRLTYAPRSFHVDDLLDARYLMASERNFRVYYSPIDVWPAANARVVLIGLTPGVSQMALAAREYCSSGGGDNDAHYERRIMANVAFAGSMRRNLCRMLDDIGVPEHCGIASAETLFTKSSHAIATTSALVYPVVTSNGANFSGGRNLSKSPLFRDMLGELLAPRLARVPDALLVPFGSCVESGLDYLCNQGILDPARVLRGFPHPSGSNGHRMRIFANNREELRQQIARLPKN